MTAKDYLSKIRYDELKGELENLKTVKRNEIAQSLEFAKALGDLSENAEYHEAREAQAALEDRISQIEDVLVHAQIIESHHSDKVEIGSVVHIKTSLSKVEKVYTLVGSEEADMSSGKISFKSPVGEALLGKKKGDKFKFKTPAGEADYHIVSIE
ncbi:MAG: transcription elongation factor GreA [bacterium]